MVFEFSEQIVLFSHLSDDQADTYHLILSADGIEHQIYENASGWYLELAATDAARARALIRAYLAEVMAPPETPLRLELPPPAWGSAVVAALFLLGCHLMVLNHSQPDDVWRLFGASARYILIGEYYRTITALMLHADSLHLLSNLAGLTLFGASVAGIMGPGAGWLLILGSGALGNLVNAWIRQSGHLSIGASTAVFAALGLLAGWQAMRLAGGQRALRGVWIPLGGGLALLAMLGAGVHTDVLAHATGFVCGLGMGIAYHLFVPVRPSWPTQRNCLLLLGLLIIAAWYRV